MSRLRVVGMVVLAALAGCDTVFGLTRDDDAPDDARIADALDAPADAVTHACAGRPAAPEFCFDFDDTTFVGYQRGNSFPIVPVQGGIAIDRRPPGYTAPNALWFDAVNPGYAAVAKNDDTASFHRLEASFRIRGTTSDTMNLGRSVSLFTIAVEAGGACRGELSINPATLEMVYSIACGNDETKTSAGMLADHWQHVMLAFDRATGQGSVSVEQSGGAQLQIFGGPGTDIPSVTFGILSAQDAGLTVAFDDITVTGE